MNWIQLDKGAAKWRPLRTQVRCHLDDHPNWTRFSGSHTGSHMMPANEAETNYPNGRSVSRIVRVGGLSKPELLAEFLKRGIELNESAQVLFANDKFTTSETISLIETEEMSVGDLGATQGAIMAEIHERAVKLGLSLCPLELGPHLRLQFPDQPEGYRGFPPSQNRAPPGSIIVASRELTEDDSIPKGFYLRRINGVLWLRGYRSGPEHIYSPEDRFVFCRPQNGPGDWHSLPTIAANRSLSRSEAPL